MAAGRYNLLFLVTKQKLLELNKVQVNQRARLKFLILISGGKLGLQVALIVIY